MKTRSLGVLVFGFGLLLVAACKSKGPVPQGQSPSEGAAPKVGTTDTTGAHPGAANPHAGMGDPHAGMAPLGGPPPGQAAPKPDASGMLDIGAIAFNTTGPWEVQAPKSSMRRAQLVTRSATGVAELIVFYFGPQGAGTAQDNIERWVGQFTKPDGSPVADHEVKPMQIGGQNVTRVEVAGTYASGMGQTGAAQAGLPDQRLIAAIVYSNDGPYYFKYLGPNATVAEFRGAFDALLDSVVASP